MKYDIPEYKKNAFTCPHCEVVAEQKWHYTKIYRNKIDKKFSFSYSTDKSDEKIYCKNLAISTCSACHREHLWFDEKMVFPEVINAPLPNDEMPEDIKKIYNEARYVFTKSSIATAALLRLALENLCDELGAKGKTINDKIGFLVKVGLPIEIQQALDTVRVAGNNAVHPGTIDLEDDDTSAILLFDMINMALSHIVWIYNIINLTTVLFNFQL